MKILNQIEHLRNSFIELKFMEVIQFSTITLPITLEEKRYDEALLCYEYLASAYFEIGSYRNFHAVMDDYEKLCLTYGNNENKMIYYYLYSLEHIFTKHHDESIEAAKKSLEYAHFLQNDELVVINYFNLAAQYRYINDVNKATIAIRLAEFYKQKLTSINATIVRGYFGALYYYASANNNLEFNRIKHGILQQLRGKHPYYEGSLLFAEAILNYNSGERQESLKLFEQAFLHLEKQRNFVLLSVVERYLERFGLMKHFRYREEMQQLIETNKREPENIRKIRNIHDDLFFEEETTALKIKYPHVVSKESTIQYVKQALTNNEALYCIRWSFITDKIEELFGSLFTEQLLFTLFESIYSNIFEHNAKVNVLTKNTGEAFIQNISEADFFKLLMKLEEKLQMSVVHSTSGVEEIPIHFGFIHSDQLPQEELSYEQLAAFADASLYYAKSHGQLYIYS
ncbi:tetratricopeptide (TPR) repeat protein [Solibacillus kalamii]|uniref:GGDEF domain-containing protein n=1 Tax=Solibacillus kalamii TaxID=1748298 RepID=A0ABX3ZKP9_9BACL|nr:hypothetical protein [Solibacillus kalamii]MBM7664283.1 tetratricopeptide (TPR) repeat protein [Solibacillus kalamii]OUZ39955.1 hypothetical protein CBM15_05445 [Solibacillus kalamii]